MNKNIKYSDIFWNFIFIFIFILYLIFFPYIRESFRVSNLEKDNTLENLLINVENKKNIFYNTWKNFLQYFLNKKYLIEKISIIEEELEKEKISSLNMINNYYRQELENSLNTENFIKNNTLEDIKINTNNNYNIISASLITKSLFDIYDNSILDRGFIDGVNENDLVFIDKNKAIGVISKINKDTSILELYSKDNNKINASIKNKSNENYISVILNGEGNGDFSAEIPGNIEVNIGENIYLGGQEDKLIGKVVKIDKKENSFYKNILIEGYYNTSINSKYYILSKIK